MINKIEYLMAFLLITLVVSTAFSYQFSVKGSGIAIIELSGKVTKDDGSPISGAKVEIVTPQNCVHQGGTYYTYTKSDGTYNGITAQYYCTSLPTNFEFKVTYGNKVNTKEYTIYEGTNSLENINFVLDYSPPQINFYPSSHDWTTYVTVTVYAIDTASGVANLWYKIINANQVCGTTGYTQVNGNSVTVTLSQSGEWKVCAYAEDKQGNVGNPVSSRIYEIDTENPTISVTSDRTCTNGPVTLTFSLDDQYSGLKKLEVYTDNSLSKTFNYNSQYTLTQKYSLTISHSTVIKGVVYDAVGHSSSKSLTIYYDISGPRAPMITSYMKYVKPGETDTIKWTAVSDVGCAGLDHYIVKISNNGVTQTYTTTATSYNFKPTKTGYYTISVAGVDKFGNVGPYSSEVTIVADGEKPAFSNMHNNATYYNGTYYVKSGENIKFTADVQDLYSGVSKCTAHVGNNIYDATLHQVSTNKYTCSFDYNVQNSFDFWFSAVDKVGNVGKSNTLNIVVDDEKPIVTMSAKQYWNTTPLINYHLEDNVLLSNVKISVNGGLPLIIPLNVKEKDGIYKVTDAIEGWNEIIFQAYDLVGNDKLATVKVCLDTKKPTLTLENPTVSGTNVVFNWNAQDNGCSGIDHYVLKLDGNEIYNGSANTYSTQVTTPGTHSWTVIAYDRAGNYQEETLTFLVDTQPPKVTLIQPTDYVNTTQVIFKFKVTDDYSDVMKCTLTVDNGFSKSMTVSNGSEVTVPVTITKEGEYNWEVRCEDNSNNVGGAKAKFILDITPPTTQSDAPSNWVNHSVTVTLTATDNLAGVAKTYYRVDGGSWNLYSNGITISTEGNHTLEFYSVDNAGNVESVKTAYVKIDLTAPQTQVISNYTWGSWTNDTVYFKFNATDSLSGVKEIYWKIDNGSWNLYNGNEISYSIEGNHTLYYYAVDNAGNIEATNSKTILIDKSVPTLTFNPLQSNWTNKDVTVQITASDSLSGVKSIAYALIPVNDSCDTASYIELNGNVAAVTISKSGEWKICAYATDNVGNKMPIQTSEVYEVDKDAPNITIASPQNNDYINTKEVYVKWDATDSLSGINNYEVYVDGSLIANTTQNDYTLNLLDGTHTIEVKAYDKAGNSNSANVTVTVDTVAPQVKITSPADGSVLNSSNVNLVWTGSDQNLDHYLVYLDGKLVANTTSNSYTLSLNEGKYTVKVVAVDKAGNENASEVTFVVDLNAPVIKYLSPVDWAPENLTVKFNVSDIESSLNCQAYIDNKLAFNKAVAPGEVSFDVSNLGGGKHNLTIKCADKYYSSEVNETLMVDNTTPVINSISPTGSVQTGSFVVTVNATDTYSGIKSVYVVFKGQTYEMNYVNGVYQITLYNDVTGTANLIVKTIDKVGHTAEKSVVLSFYTTSSGGGGTIITGPTGGGCTLNGYKCTSNSDCCSGYCNNGICTNMPVDVKLDVKVEPPMLTVFDNQTAKFTFIISNSGKDPANKVTVSVEGVNGTLSAEEFSLAAGTQKVVYFMTKLPEGDYTGTVKVTFENQSVTKEFTLKVLSYEKYQEETYTKNLCSNASMHIIDLASKGMNVSKLYEKYDEALKLISVGNYSKAKAICEEITNTMYNPQPVNPTPFFIIVNGIKSNPQYVGAAVGLLGALAIWFKKAAIIRWWQMRKLR